MFTNGASLVTDPANGEILAMVGSKDYFDNAIAGNVNIATSLRQPGSSIKPINYAVGLLNGYKPPPLLLTSRFVSQTEGDKIIVRSITTANGMD